MRRKKKIPRAMPTHIPIRGVDLVCERAEVGVGIAGEVVEVVVVAVEVVFSIERR